MVCSDGQIARADKSGQLRPIAARNLFATSHAHLGLSEFSGVADRHWNTWRAFINGEKMISQRPAAIIDPLCGDVDDSFFKILPGGGWGATVSKVSLNT